MAGLSERVRSLVRADVASLSPYDPNFTPCEINLSANENTYGMPVEVREAIDAAVAATATNRYPDPMSNELRDQIAAWHGVSRENVCVGNGGDELLFNFFLAFGGPGCSGPRSCGSGATATPLRQTWTRCSRRPQGPPW